MSRKNKFNQRGLKLRTKMSDYDLLSSLQVITIEYSKAVKSEIIAKEILMKYGINNAFSYRVYSLKKKYNSLINSAKNRDIIIPNEWYDIEITERDVLARINEIEAEQKRTLERNSYLFTSDEEYNHKVELVTLLFKEIRENEVLEIKEKFGKTKTK